jgi:acyl carrier protein
MLPRPHRRDLLSVLGASTLTNPTLLRYTIPSPARTIDTEARRTAVETYDAVANKIREYLSQNFLFSDDGFAYEDDASFLELGIIDSFGFMELLHWVEQEFSISVADDELVPDNFDSVRKLSSFVLGKQSGGT